MTLLEWARNCFANDRYATQATGITIQDVGIENNGGVCICQIELQEYHLNARNAVMGGVFFTLADFAAGVAVNLPEASARLKEPLLKEELYDLHWVSTSSNINFLAQPKGKIISAKAVCLRQGRNTGLYQVNVFEGERLLAVVTTTGMRI